MKLLLLLIIRIYWFLIPPSKRRKCLFKISCSHYVFDKTSSGGFISGLKALSFRIKNCNSKYNIIIINEEKFLVTATNQVINEDEINTSILT